GGGGAGLAEAGGRKALGGGAGGDRPAQPLVSGPAARWSPSEEGAMPKRSAGILMFRRRGGEVEVLLMHPGGPFWAKKDLGAWSIPKGEYSEDEDALAAAKREFEEETGAGPQGDFLPLAEVVQRGRKIVTAWGLEGDFDPATLTTGSSWNGRRRAGARRRFPKSTARNGFRWRTPGGRFSRRRASSSPGCSPLSASNGRSQRPTLHMAASRRRSAFGFSTKMRGAMRGAPGTWAALVSAIAVARRERQRASG